MTCLKSLSRLRHSQHVCTCPVLSPQDRVAFWVGVGVGEVHPWDFHDLKSLSVMFFFLSFPDCNQVFECVNFMPIFSFLFLFQFKLRIT